MPPYPNHTSERLYLDLADALCGLGQLEGLHGATIRAVRADAAVGAAPFDPLCDRALSALRALQVAASADGDLQRLRMLVEAASSVERLSRQAA